MAKQQRISPVGVDKAIAAFQDYLYSTAKIGGVLISDWESYDRVYKNPKAARGSALIPEHFTGGKDYQEVFYNDNFSLTSFFIMDEDSEFENGQMIADVSLIFQANLDELYPTIAHRADEELRNLFIHLSQKYYSFDSFQFINLETTIDSVYREFEREQIRLEDMSEKHCFRLNYEVRYTPECCTDC